MKHIAEIVLFTTTLAIMLIIGIVMQPQMASAAKPCVPSATQKCCGEVPVTIDVGCNPQDAAQSGIILAYVFAIIRVVTGLVGVGVVGTIVFGGLTYMTARDNAAQTQKAVVIIRTAIIALICYIFAATLISFLIPGGLFSNV